MNRDAERLLAEIDSLEKRSRRARFLTTIFACLAAAVAMLMMFNCSGDRPFTPTATATVAPTPVPTAAPRFDPATACGAPVLDPDTARKARCATIQRVQGGAFSESVYQAQLWVAANRTDLFFPGTGTAKDAVDYADAVVLRLATANGLCAQRGETDDEIRVKNGNGAGASGGWFDVLLSDNRPWAPPLLERQCDLGPGW